MKLEGPWYFVFRDSSLSMGGEDDVVVGDAATFLREAHLQPIDNYNTPSETLDEFDHKVCGVPLTHEQQEILSCAKFSSSPLRHRDNDVFLFE